MRVLFSSTPGHGHVLPMVPLARALAAAGHDVRWATGPDACRLVSGAGLDARPAGTTDAERDQIRLAILAEAVKLPPDDRAAYVFPRLFGGYCAERMLSELLPLATSWSPDLIVHEQGELAAPLVATLLGVPNVVHAFGGAAPRDIVEAAALYVAPLWAAHGQPLDRYAGCYRHCYLDICPPSVQTVPLDHVGLVQPVRPVTYAGEEPAQLPGGLEQDDGRPLIYLTLGTVPHLSSSWRAAVEGVASLDARVLATVGPHGDLAALGNQPSNVRIERYVAQTAVLPHCTIVVSHAGSGTMLAALARGIPQVCLPQAADQFRNAAGLVGCGAGLALRPGEVTAAAVREAVSSVLHDPAYRRGAEALRAEIAAMPAPEDVATRLAAMALADPAPAG